jgi:osmotically inducible protein OsmC
MVLAVLSWCNQLLILKEHKMAIKKAEAIWQGTLKEGSGTFKVGSGTLSGSITWASRFADDTSKTNPEELVGAAHASCYAMHFSGQLTTAGFPPESIDVTAELDFGRDDIGSVIKGITLNVEAKVAGVSQEKFDELVQVSKERCPISRALASVPLMVNAKLIS